MRARGVVVLVAVLAAVAVAFALSRGDGDGPALDPAPVARRDAATPPVSNRVALATEQDAVDVDVASALDGELARLNNEALDRLDGADFDGAVERLERCVAEAPDRGVFRRNLAEALARRARHRYEGAGTMDSAVTDLERATELAPERDDLARLLERWRRELELVVYHFVEQGQYFEISYDPERHDILEHSQTVLDALERDYGDLYDFFQVDPVRDSGVRIRVLLYDSTEFSNVTGLGDWAGGAFDGVVRVAVADVLRESSRWRRTLRHELVHAFVRRVGGRGVPGWLNEGLAQWLERDPLVDAARRHLRGIEPFSLEELAGSIASWSDREAIARAYDQSLAFVDHLARQYGAEALRRMVAAHADGGDAASAFEAWTRVSLEAALSDLVTELAD